MTYKIEITGDSEAVGVKNGLELRVITKVVNGSSINLRYVLTNLNDENVTVYSSVDSAYCKLYGEFGLIRKFEPLITVTEPVWIIMLEPGEQVKMPGSQTYEIRRPGNMYITGVWDVFYQPTKSDETTISIETIRIPIKVSITGLT